MEEIRVSNSGGFGPLITRAAESLEKNNSVTMSGVNFAISRAVDLSEMLKHKIKGLNQVNTIESLEDQTKFSITLSYSASNTSSKGY